MKRMLCMALVGVGGLAWVALWSGLVLALPENRQDSGPGAFHSETSEAFSYMEIGKGGERVDGRVVAVDHPAITTQLLYSSNIFRGGGWPDVTPDRSLSSSTPTVNSIDAKSKLMEPRWLIPRLSGLEKKGTEASEGALPANPVIPEQAALFLFGAGLLALAAFGKKWKR